LLIRSSGGMSSSLKILPDVLAHIGA
jgi:hypothetical protein